MRPYFLRALLVVIGCTLASGARAAAIHFGQDSRDGTRPQTFAAAESARSRFLAAIGASVTEGFESMPTGDGFISGARPPLALELSGTHAVIDVTNALAEVWHHVVGGRYAFGGANYLLFAGNSQRASTLDIVFGRPVAAFGFAAVDVGDFAERLSVVVTLVDGSMHAHEIGHLLDDPAANAAAFFFGIVPDAPIQQLRIVNQPGSPGSPYIAFDEFTVPRIAAGEIAPLPAVPEPGAAALLVSGLAAVVWTRWRKRRGPHA